LGTAEVAEFAEDAEFAQDAERTERGRRGRKAGCTAADASVLEAVSAASALDAWMAAAKTPASAAAPAVEGCRPSKLTYSGCWASARQPAKRSTRRTPAAATTSAVSTFHAATRARSVVGSWPAK
jgi:hypothetical protein